MTNDTVPAPFYQVGPYSLISEGSAVMVRNFERSKGRDFEIVLGDPAPFIPQEPVMVLDVEANLSTSAADALQAIRVIAALPEIPEGAVWDDELGTYVTEVEMDAIPEGQFFQTVEFADGSSETILFDAFEVAGVEADSPWVHEHDEIEADRHARYQELHDTSIVELRKRASKAGLKNAYKGYDKRALVEYLLSH